MKSITHLGDPILRQKAEAVTDVFSEDTLRIIDTLVSTLIDQKGIGIAAPQVGILKQIFIVAPNQKVIPPFDKLDTGLVVINPSISINSNEVQYEWEGCLSIPGIRGYTPRNCDITITYTNRHGEIKSEDYSDFTARIFLHEYDHLQGILFIDRLEDIKTDLITDHYYKDLLEEEDL